MIALNISLFIFGLILLIISADWLINSSVKLSFLYRLTPLFIGAVIVAFGTSAPEAGVGIMAALRNEKAIALGNIVGSNIANIGLVLGICSLFRPLTVNNKDIFRRELPILVFSGVLLYGLSWDLVISRIDGLILLIIFTVFCIFSYMKAKKKEVDQELEGFKFKDALQKTNSAGRVIVIVLLSLIGVVIGADCMVRGGSRLAVVLGVSPWIIAITVFAIGTSLPELAASFAAVFKKVPSISVGNIIGSNIFNILFVLGIVSLIRPISLPQSLLYFEFPVMIVFSLILFTVLKTAYKITRWEGLFMVCGYIAFLFFLLRK
jgi:cation:H+ antiporter